MSIGTIILIILVIALLGGFSGIGGGLRHRLLWRRRPRPDRCHSADLAVARQTLNFQAAPVPGRFLLQVHSEISMSKHGHMPRYSLPTEATKARAMIHRDGERDAEATC